MHQHNRVFVAAQRPKRACHARLTRIAAENHGGRHGQTQAREQIMESPLFPLAHREQDAGSALAPGQHAQRVGQHGLAVKQQKLLRRSDGGTHARA